MNKDQILKNVKNLSADQLFSFIKKGVVTLIDLMGTGDLDPNKRKIIDSLLAIDEKVDDDLWENCRYGDEEKLREYISKFPNGKHVQEAKDKIDMFEEKRQLAKKEKEKIIYKLKNDPNSYDPSMILDYLSKRTLTENDLKQCGIPEHIIDMLENINQPNLTLGDIPKTLPSGFTEIYFWGIPGSGKTCALGAILGTADNKGYLEYDQSPAYDYMTKLINMFNNGSTSILPPHTTFEVTQYLPFVLRKSSNNPRSIQLIELSGEIFQCFYHVIAGLPFPSAEHAKTFETLKIFLSSQNHKIHFFFIDYSFKNEKDVFGYTQKDYLSAASSYFKQNQIFRDTTIAIYVVVTKSDLMHCEKGIRLSRAIEFLSNNNFKSFMNTLESKCIENHINAQKLLVETFSLGKVYFQYLCDFESDSAEKFIEILFSRINPQKKTIFDFLKK
jgi:hypothetical protein